MTEPMFQEQTLGVTAVHSPFLNAVLVIKSSMKRCWFIKIHGGHIVFRRICLHVPCLFVAARSVWVSRGASKSPQAVLLSSSRLSLTADEALKSILSAVGG